MFDSLDKYPVQYDFKTTFLDLINNKTGKIKDKYKCLSFMITLPLMYSSVPPDSIIEILPIINKVKLTATQEIDGYLNFNIPSLNDQTVIVSSFGNILEFNYILYHYDVEVNIIDKGDLDVDLRFMTFNQYQPNLASNLNDIYGNETVYSVNSGDIINFTITGRFTNFFAYYPNRNFKISMKVTVSNKKIPTFICYKTTKCNKCTCFEIDNIGYFKVKGHDVPVYINVDNGNINRLLYPAFANLRELFLNTTFNNSLPAPVWQNLKSRILLKLSATRVGSIKLYPQGPADNLPGSGYDGNLGGLSWQGVMFSEFKDLIPPENGFLTMVPGRPENGADSVKPWQIRLNPNIKTGYYQFSWPEKILTAVFQDPNFPISPTYLAFAFAGNPAWIFLSDIDGKTQEKIPLVNPGSNNADSRLPASSFRISAATPDFFFYMGNILIVFVYQDGTPLEMTIDYFSQ